MAISEEEDLRTAVTEYLRAHHTMTVATVEPSEGKPHAASVFYAVDDRLRLIFLSKPTSAHGRHIGRAGAVAVTVTEAYDDWERIQGVQMWGTARLLRGTARTGALACYMRRFPFVHDLLAHPRYAGSLLDIGVYRIDPDRAGFTDNTTDVFGRRMWDEMGE